MRVSHPRDENKLVANYLSRVRIEQSTYRAMLNVTGGEAVETHVLAQPEMEKRRSPLV
jgi:hypothetical protein